MSITNYFDLCAERHHPKILALLGDELKAVDEQEEHPQSFIAQQPQEVLGLSLGSIPLIVEIGKIAIEIFKAIQNLDIDTGDLQGQVDKFDKLQTLASKPGASTVFVIAIASQATTLGFTWNNQSRQDQILAITSLVFLLVIVIAAGAHRVSDWVIHLLESKKAQTLTQLNVLAQQKKTAFNAYLITSATKKYLQASDEHPEEKIAAFRSDLKTLKELLQDMDAETIKNLYNLSPKLATLRKKVKAANPDDKDIQTYIAHSVLPQLRALQNQLARNSSQQRDVKESNELELPNNADHVQEIEIESHHEEESN